MIKKKIDFTVAAVTYFLSPLLCLTRQCSPVHVCAYSSCARCRAKVMGSRRKARSRVHGGVKEPRARLLFAPPPTPPLFLPTGGCVPGATAASLSNKPANAHNLFVFLRLWELPRQESSSITTSAGAASLARRIPPRLLHLLLPVYTPTGSPRAQHKHAALQQFFSNVLILKR